MKVSVGDIELYARESGAGRPIVLLHGGPGLDSSVWFPGIEPLACDYRLIAVDLRANGRSDSGDPSRWTIQQMADDVEALIKRLDLDKPIIYGWSFGSFVAQQHMASHGTADAYILMGTIASLDALTGIDARLAAFEPVELREQVTRSWELEAKAETAQELSALMRDQLPWQVGDPTGPLVAELLARADEIVYSPAILRHFAASGDYGFVDHREQFRSFEGAVLVLNGELDRTTPPESARELAELLPHGEYVELRGCGHMLLDEDQTSALSAVREFVARVGRA